DSLRFVDEIRLRDAYPGDHGEAARADPVRDLEVVGARAVADRLAVLVEVRRIDLLLLPRARIAIHRPRDRRPDDGRRLRREEDPSEHRLPVLELTGAEREARDEPAVARRDDLLAGHLLDLLLPLLARLLLGGLSRASLGLEPRGVLGGGLDA